MCVHKYLPRFISVARNYVYGMSKKSTHEFKYLELVTQFFECGFFFVLSDSVIKFQYCDINFTNKFAKAYQTLEVTYTIQNLSVKKNCFE